MHIHYVDFLTLKKLYNCAQKFEWRTERRLLGRHETQHEGLADGDGAQAVRDVEVAAADEALVVDALDVVADLNALHLRDLTALADPADEWVARAVVGDR